MSDTLDLAQQLAAAIKAEKARAQSRPEPGPLAYTLDKAAKATGLSLRTITREVKSGRLKASKFRRRVLITAEELQRYLREHSNG